MFENHLEHITTAGLKLLISLSCLGATIYQSILLYDNYKSKDTLRKNSEIYYSENYTTPMIIVCSDPGNTNPEEPLIEMDNDVYGIIPQIKTFRTIYKVHFTLCNASKQFKMPAALSRGYATLLIALQCLELWLKEPSA